MNGVVGEGNLLPKDAGTFTIFRQALTEAGIPSNAPLWFTGDWNGSNSLAATGDPTSGYFVQLYDYYPSALASPNNNIFNKDNNTKTGIPLPTDPNNANISGPGLLTSLKSIDGSLFADTARTVLTLNFSGLLVDGPVFGPIPVTKPGDPTPPSGVVTPWGLGSSYTLLSDLQKQAVSRSGSLPTPQIAIWSADTALAGFYASTLNNPNVFTTSDVSSPSLFKGTIINQPIIFTHNSGEPITLSIKINDPNLKGLGLVPLHDNAGGLVTADGYIVSATEPAYNQLALQLALQDGNWKDVSSNTDQSTTNINWTALSSSSYGLIVQEQNGVILTSLGKNALGNSWIANGVTAGHSALGLQLELWSPIKGAAFDDAVIKITGLQAIGSGGLSLG